MGLFDWFFDLDGDGVTDELDFYMMMALMEEENDECATDEEGDDYL